LIELLSSLALVLLTLVGYSSGAVLGARKRTPVPGLLDLLVIIALWGAALLTRGPLGKWAAIGVWLLAALLVGALLAAPRAHQYPKAEAVKNGRDLWNAWKDFARRMGNYQSRVLMALLYFTVVLPFGLGVRLLGDPLQVRAPADSRWSPKEMIPQPSLDDARRQF